MTATGPSPVSRPLLASFLVFALPLFTVHGPAWMFGASVLRTVLQRDSPRPAAWILADVALLLVAQLVLFLLFRLVFERATVPRLAALGGGVLGLTALANLLHGLVIPAYFLVPPDKARESHEWIDQCSVDEAFLLPVRSPADCALASSGQAWIGRGKDQAPWLVESPGCTLTELGAKADGIVGTRYVVPDGASLTQVQLPNEDAKWIYQPGPKGDRIEVLPPEGVSGVDGGPILSNDGTWVGWIRRPEAAASPELVMRHVDGTDERTFSLRAAGIGGLELLAVDLDANEILLARNQREYLSLGLDGFLRWGPVQPKDVEPLATTFRRLGADGWVAWDGYRDEGSYRLSWSLPFGKGHHEVQAGRLIHAVAVDPGGQYIALSVGSAYSFGRAKDAVYVLRADDGAEIFRRYLPRYSRPEVAFLAPGLLAYGDVDQHGRQRVQVTLSPED